MASRIELRAGDARAEILPELGAALSGLWLDGRPVLRPWSGRAEDGPFAVASIVLAPFSNRVSGPFEWRGQVHDLPRNLPTEAFPIHGDAFSRPWALVGQTRSSAELVLKDGAFGPLRYHARLRYRINASGLASEILLTSRASERLPFGVGFHPWFPRDRDTRIRFSANAVWLEDRQHLPAQRHPVDIPEIWDFSKARALPSGWVNNGFDGWHGTAQILQDRAGVSTTLQASAILNTLILFSPGAEETFFCLEPVSHPVDAFNLPKMPGMTVLDPQGTLNAWMRLTWRP